MKEVIKGVIKSFAIRFNDLGRTDDWLKDNLKLMSDNIERLETCVLNVLQELEKITGEKIEY
jgi:hypothetical protein